MASEPYSKVVRLRLTDVEETGVKALAAARGMTVSALLRGLIGEAMGRGPTMTREDRAAIMQLSVQIRAVGVNLNQIARSLNAAELPSAARISGLLAELMAILDDVDDRYVRLCRQSVRRNREPGGGAP